MTAKTRDAIYFALFILNGALIAAHQQDLIPHEYSQYALLASLVVASAMKAFGTKDAPKPSDPPAQEPK